MNDTRFYIILTKGNDYIVMGSYDSREQAELSLLWYNRHKSFFNGVFEIEEV